MPSLSFPSTTIGDTIESPVLHMLRMNLKNLQSYTHDYQLAQLRASQQHQEIRSESYRDQLSEIQSSQVSLSRTLMFLIPEIMNPLASSII